jgi:hypothetical protein
MQKAAIQGSAEGASQVQWVLGALLLQEALCMSAHFYELLDIAQVFFCFNGNE